jgi:hypothetical protein
MHSVAEMNEVAETEMHAKEEEEVMFKQRQWQQVCVKSGGACLL